VEVPWFSSWRTARESPTLVVRKSASVVLSRSFRSESIREKKTTNYRRPCLSGPAGSMRRGERPRFDALLGFWCSTRLMLEWRPPAEVTCCGGPGFLEGPARRADWRLDLSDSWGVVGLP
jgi:hypothetical protein